MYRPVNSYLDRLLSGARLCVSTAAGGARSQVCDTVFMLIPSSFRHQTGPLRRPLQGILSTGGGGSAQRVRWADEGAADGAGAGSFSLGGASREQVPLPPGLCRLAFAPAVCRCAQMSSCRRCCARLERCCYATASEGSGTSCRQHPRSAAGCTSGTAQLHLTAILCLSPHLGNLICRSVLGRP